MVAVHGIDKKTRPRTVTNEEETVNFGEALSVVKKKMARAKAFLARKVEEAIPELLADWTALEDLYSRRY